MAARAAGRQAGGQGRRSTQAALRARWPKSMPRLILEARRIAATVIHGLHGRRRAGPGENFWQYRRFLSGEPARRVDWRRSARDDHLYVREREWEAAHTVWLWPDRSPSMLFSRRWRRTSKLERAWSSPSRWPRFWYRPASASACPTLCGRPAAATCWTSSRMQSSTMRANGRACRHLSRHRLLPRSSLFPISGVHIGRCARPCLGLRPMAPTDTRCRSSTQRRRHFPIRAGSSSSSRKARAHHRRPGGNLEAGI